mgnify:CR=1 FL=1
MSDKYNGNYPAAWSQSDIDFYTAHGKEPSKTSNGLWVSDIVRESNDLSSWSMAELFALASGELFTTKTIGDDTFYKALRGKAMLEDSDAIRWGEEDLMDWLLYEKTPARSPGGFYINDPDRWTKNADQWLTKELIDLGLGYFGELDRSQLYILDEASDRLELPMGITFEDFKVFVETGVKPAVTLDGVLINDRNRATKKVEDWTDIEVEAWVRGDIESQTLGLFKRALDQFGGEWYWTLEHLKSWVITGEVPVVEHDYTKYTDAQLNLLISKEEDSGAKEELAKRYPIEEVVEEEPTVVEPVAVAEPVKTEPIISMGTFRRKAPVVGTIVEEEPVTEAVAEPTRTVWTQLVREDTPIYMAMVSETPFTVMEDTERRRLLSASRWSVEELVGWARGLIPQEINTNAGSLMAALRAACGPFTANWTDGAVKSFVVNRELPEGFDEGILVEDILRDKKHPGAWSDEELCAWAKGKIVTTIDPAQVLFSMRVRMKVPDRLTAEEAKVFVATGGLPEVIIPVIEADKPVSEVQMIAWLKGEMRLAEGFDTKPLFDKARSMLKIDQHWTDDGIVEHYRHGKTPAILDDGVYVDDRLRDNDSAATWSWKELRHLLAGNVRADFEIGDAIDRVRSLMKIQFGIESSTWDTSEVFNFLATESKPKTLADGVHVNDPTRPLKNLNDWRDAELRAWLRNEIEMPDKYSEEDGWDEIYRRFKVPLFWYREDARKYVLTGEMVKALPSGIWVRDVNRDGRPGWQWTRREVKAWARGQIVPGINAPEEDLAQQAIRLFGLSIHLDLESIKRRVSNITEESMTMTIAFVTEDLAAYEKGRKEAADNANTSAPFQSMLDRCINRVVRLEGDDFIQGWTELRNFFHKNSKDICSLKKVYTGVGQMAITPKGLRHFQNMTTILIRTCDPAKSVAAVKLIDWNVALKELSNEKARQQLLAYYGIQ